ncbi:MULTISPECIES: lipopolysaccharide transport periplasmic protein LptA [Rheinheimera]|uniref:Lipopolysaccharide export system protein LptA n=1 Tax=Rheinheimera marina TaxID=1774958 RepID=A0ABV9JMB4_9GAMM
MKITKVLALLLCTAALASQAAQDDYKKEIQVGSDRQFGSLKDKVMTFVDNVKVQQGSLLIEADKLEVIATEGKGKEVFIASGNPAHYSQEFEQGKKIIAKAKEIKYDVGAALLILIGEAELSQAGSMVQGSVIRYNLVKQELAAEADGKKSERVTTVFTPEGKQDQ